MLVYADTSLWNCLCDYPVDPEALISGLSTSDAQLVLGSNVVYELAKTFLMNRADAKERGQRLFSYLDPYLSMNIPCFTEIREILKFEAAHVAGEIPRVDPFWDANVYAQLIREVRRLAAGEFDQLASSFIGRRKNDAAAIPLDFQSRLAARPELKERIARISEKELPVWLEQTMTGSRGREALQRQLANVYRRPPDRPLRVLAKKLLGNRRYRISRALTRSDLYLNWRCARRGSVRADLPDDAYHTVNASYCDIFLTTERDQAEHAVLFSPHIRSFVFDQRQNPIDWFFATVRDSRSV